jgi:hypothetical protein
MSTSQHDHAKALALAQNFGAEALELNLRLATEDPTDAASRTRLARCYVEAGQLDEAEAQYREVLSIDPRNRIAAGGLEVIERRRRGSEPATSDGAGTRKRAGRPVRERKPLRRSEPAVSLMSEPVPQSFNGFSADDFEELASCPTREIRPRFAPRVVDLLRRVNALGSSVELAGIREAGKRHLFRAGRSDVNAGPSHWDVFSMGGRWEPQLNIGMHGSRGAAGNWLRVGVGFDLREEDPGSDAEGGVRTAGANFVRFQEILESPRRSLFLGWMVKENGRIQDTSAGPRFDLREPSQMARAILDADPRRTEWMFFGKWLSPDQPEEAQLLSDPLMLVRAIDRVLTGLVPIWRALHEQRTV